MLAQATFRELPEVHRRFGGEPLTGALFDLGLSSQQIDDPERGMSFMREGPLDLRMDRTAGQSAAERLLRADERELARVLRELGDVRTAARLARAMVAAARAGTLSTTHELVAVIERAWGGRVSPRRLAPVFQALRMWINEEAEEIEAMLAWLPLALRPGGVAVTLAYHSGEDRRIKQALRGSRGTPRRLPLTSEVRPPEGPWQEITRKVVTPSREERTRNPRSRSARLRAFRRRPT
jgi:16S rRNA (cytosine1402-N4)-methyltransferase